MEVSERICSVIPNLHQINKVVRDKFGENAAKIVGLTGLTCEKSERTLDLIDIR